MQLTLIGPVYPYRGGIAHYTGLLARSLLKDNHNIQLLSFQRQYPAWLYPGKSDLEPGKRTLDIVTQYILDPLYPWTWRRTAHDIIEYHPQAAIIQWWTTFWAPALFSIARSLRNHKIPVIFIIHNVMPHEKKRWDPWLAKLALSQGDKFIIQSSREEQRLLALFPSANVSICSMPIFDLNQPKVLTKSMARQQLGISLTKPVLLCFGIVRPYKGLQFAIEAVAKLNLKAKPYHLLVAGEIWDDKQRYQDLIDHLKLTEQVTLEDRYIPNDEIGRYFSAADVFLAPYIDGTQSAAIKLALGYGLPIVASDILADDILTHNPQVLFVPPGDSIALSTAIEAATNLEYRLYPTHDLVKESWTRLVNTIEDIVSDLEDRT
jgi:glycosyltransferase involved in cell wall biosynthesis